MEAALEVAEPASQTASIPLNKALNRTSTRIIELDLDDEGLDTLSTVHLPFSHDLIRESRPAALRISAAHLEHLIDCLQSAFVDARGKVRSPEGRLSCKSISRVMVKILTEFHCLPPSFFISGITLTHEDAVASGGFGDIFKGRYRGKLVALKRLRLYKPEHGPLLMSQRFYREVTVWGSLDHPHVLPLSGIDASIFCPCICMVSPWMENGTLLAFIEKAKCSEAEITRLLYEAAQGLKYLHSHTTVHGDIRCSNILVSYDRTAKLADFGLSNILAENAMTVTTSEGSIPWSAPETFWENCHRTYASDIYAFGCTILEAHSGKPPFAGMFGPAIIYQVMNGSRPHRPVAPEKGYDVSSTLWTLAEDCWKPPLERPTAESLVAHPAFRSQVSDEVSVDGAPMMNMISSKRELLALRPEGHPSRAFSLCDLSLSLRSLYEQSRDTAALEEAISLQREALALRPSGNTKRGYSLFILSKTLRIQYYATKDSAILDEAILLAREALVLRPQGHPDRGYSLAELALCLRDRYNRICDDSVLQEAISLGRELLAMRPEGHPCRTSALFVLATSLRLRYKRPAALQEAIELYRQTLESRPRGHSFRSSSLTMLAICLRLRHEQTGERALLEEAIALNRETLELRPNGHTGRSYTLFHLSMALRQLYSLSLDIAVLDEAISLQRQALALRPQGHPERCHSLSELALCLRLRSPQDRYALQEAISILRQTLVLCSGGHTHYDYNATELGQCLRLHACRTGSGDALEEAISLLRDVLARLPQGHDRSFALSELGECLRLRYTRSHDVSALEEALSVLREALSLRPAGHCGHALTLKWLLDCLRARNQISGDEAALTEEVSLRRQYLDLHPEGDPNRGEALHRLGVTLVAQYGHTGDRAILDEAVTVHRSAVALLPEAHPNSREWIDHLSAATQLQSAGLVEGQSEGVVVVP